MQIHHPRILCTPCRKKEGLVNYRFTVQLHKGPTIILMTKTINSLNLAKSLIQFMSRVTIKLSGRSVTNQYFIIIAQDKKARKRQSEKNKNLQDTLSPPEKQSC